MIKTNTLTPISDLLFDEMQKLVFEYREIEGFLTSCGNIIELYTNTSIEDGCVLTTSTALNNDILDLLHERLDQIENELNLLGYTMQDEPKEWQYHVNVLKGEDDE